MILRTRFTRAGVFLAGMAALAPVVAQTASPPAPRIGLALSGGGARGLAHVGVLKVLEEMRIPISCVTGTSMGAIVGGTFAAGRTPAEMETLVLEADWDAIFRDKPPRKEIALRRKVFGCRPVEDAYYIYTLANCLDPGRSASRSVAFRDGARFSPAMATSLGNAVGGPMGGNLAGHAAQPPGCSDICAGPFCFCNPCYLNLARILLPG